MRAKFIYERFKEDSDPIRDMSIGLEGEIRKWIKEEYKALDKDVKSLSYTDLLVICIEKNKFEYVKYLVDNAKDFGITEDNITKLLSMAIEYKRDTDIILYLMSYGDKNVIDYVKKHMKK